MSEIYKIIAKVLTNWMRMVVDRVISKLYNAFIKGSQILDYVLIANECLDSHIKFGEPKLLCKLDMEKAYDHIDLKFLLYLLKRCGFGEKLCYWIKRCILTIRFSILINSTPLDFFRSSRGVRQGDHLSHFLFVIVIEALSKMVDASIESGCISSFSVGAILYERINSSHILFAYDTLVFFLGEFQSNGLSCHVGDFVFLIYMGLLLKRWWQRT